MSDIRFRLAVVVGICAFALGFVFLPLDEALACSDFDCGIQCQSSCENIFPSGPGPDEEWGTQDDISEGGCLDAEQQGEGCGGSCYDQGGGPHFWFGDCGEV